MNISRYNDLVVANEKKDRYILEKQDTFYIVDAKVMKEATKDSELIEVDFIKDNIIYVLLSIVTIIFVLLYYFHNVSFVIIDKNFWIATSVLLINIPIHEIGHILSLKFFYPNSKFKIGFKFVFIYPAFYVDTSYSYMLPKYKRIAVYLAGNVMNCIFVLIISKIWPNTLQYLYIVISNILTNFIPIIKSDGYYAFLTLRGKYNKNKSKKKQIIDDFIRGAIMFFILYLLT